MDLLLWFQRLEKIKTSLRISGGTKKDLRDHPHGTHFGNAKWQKLGGWLSAEIDGRRDGAAGQGPSGRRAGRRPRSWFAGGRSQTAPCSWAAPPTIPGWTS